MASRAVPAEEPMMMTASSASSISYFSMSPYWRPVQAANSSATSWMTFFASIMAWAWARLVSM